MDVPPEQGQAMFVRDLVPDLHKDGGFVLYNEGPGLLEFSDGVVPEASSSSFGEMVDADVVGHPEENEEPDLAETAPRGPATIFSGEHKGATMPGGENTGQNSGLRHWLSRRIRVEFSTAPSGTLVTLKGRVGRDMRDALGRLGSAGHWPATAGDPHD